MYIGGCPTDRAHIIRASVFVLQSRSIPQRVVILMPRMRSFAPASLSASDPFVVVADNVPTMIWMSAPDGAWTFVNRARLQFTGVPRGRQLGLGWMHAIHRLDRRATSERYLEAVHTRQPFTLEYRLKRADGSYAWVVDHGVPRFDA